jgi:hypothetical protein
MMPFQDRAGQIVKLASTRPTLISLAMGLLRVKAALDNLGGTTGRAADSVGPPQLTNHIIAFGFIDEGLKIHEHLDHLIEELGGNVTASRSTSLKHRLSLR